MRALRVGTDEDPLQKDKNKDLVKQLEESTHSRHAAGDSLKRAEEVC